MIRILLTALFIPFVAQRAFAVDVTACSTTVSKGDVGVLQNDLVCADAPYAVLLLEHATLNLNGHSITGTFSNCSSCIIGAVDCRARSCTVTGPGEIYGTNSPAVTVGWNSDLRTVRRAHLNISNVNIHDCADGVSGAQGRVQTRITATDVTLSHSGGIGASILNLTNVSVDHSAVCGIGGTKVRGTNVTTNDNTRCGIFTDKVLSIDGLVATGNGAPGVYAGGFVKLKNSTVTGNIFLDIGPDAAMDVVTTRFPTFLDSICGKSQKVAAVIGATWGICTDDF